MNNFQEKYDVFYFNDGFFLGKCHKIKDFKDSKKSKLINLKIELSDGVKHSIKKGDIILLESRFLKEKINVKLRIIDIDYMIDCIYVLGKIVSYREYFTLKMIRDIKIFYSDKERPWIFMDKYKYRTYLDCCYHETGVEDYINNKYFLGKYKLDHSFIYDKYSLFAEFGYAFRGRLGYMGRDYDSLWDCLLNVDSSSILKLNKENIFHKLPIKDREMFVDLISDMSKRFNIIL